MSNRDPYSDSKEKSTQYAPCLSTTPRDNVARLCRFMRLKRSEETIPVPAAAARSTSTAASGRLSPRVTGVLPGLLPPPFA